MIEVIIQRDGEEDRTIVLKGGVYGIGRHEDNEIHLDDREVSRKHARLLVDGDTVVIEDLSSGNGTYVDDAPVVERALGDGDVVEILPFTMRFAKSVEGLVAPPRPSLLVVDGPDEGTRFPLAKDEMVAGRGHDAEVRFDDSGCSRHHARFAKTPSGWIVRDLDSANGVYLNDQAVREAPIAAGDTLVLGNTTVVFQVGEAAPKPGRGDRKTIPDAGTDRPDRHTLADEPALAEGPAPAEETMPVDTSSASVVPRTPTPTPPPPTASGGGQTGCVVALVGLILVLIVVIASALMFGLAQS